MIPWNPMLHLNELGWNSFFETSYPLLYRRFPAALPPPTMATSWSGRQPAKWMPASRGPLRNSGALWPAVGDWVVLRNGETVIDFVLARKTCVSRKQPEREIREQVLAANIDVLFIVSGLDRDYNPRRIERFLVMANESGARPVVLLNKADLAPELGLDLDRTRRQRSAAEPRPSPCSPSARVSDHGLDALPAAARTGPDCRAHRLLRRRQIHHP